MWSTYFYYISSPLNFFIIFFKNNIVLFLTFISVLKIGLSGLFMFIFLNNVYSKKYYYSLIFSLCYSLMGFNLYYFGNNFWLDIVYITPLLLFSIDRMVSKRKYILFLILIIYSLFCNFYLSFSVIIFSFIYYIYICFSKNLFLFKRIINFIIIIILSILCSSFFLLPIIFELLNNFSSRISYGGLINSDYLNIPYLFYRFLVGSTSLLSQFEIYSYSPNIYCSILCLILNVCYYFNSNITKKEKIISIIINLFFISSMVLNPIYLMWHGFSATNGSYYRFSYLWSFFIIYISFKSLYKFDDKLFKNKNLYFIFFLIFLDNIFLILSNSYPIFYNGLEIIISVLFLTSYLISLKLFKKFLIITSILELFINMLFCYNDDNSLFGDLNNFSDNYNNYCISDFHSDFIRADYLTYNSGLYCNYSTISSYYSTTNDGLNNFLRKCGLLSNNMYVNSYNFSTDLLYSIFSFSYVDDLYSNEDIISIGYMINYKNNIENGNSIFFQQDLLNSFFDGDLVYFNIYPLIKIDNFNYYYYNDGFPKYVLIDDKYKHLLEINSDDVKYVKIFGGIFFKTLRISNETNDKVFIDLKFNKDYIIDNEIPKIYLYELNYDILKEAIDILKEQQLNVTKINKNILEGNIEVKKDNQYLFLSIPYEKGWHIYVDGKKVNYEKLFDAFIGIKLNKGYHEITMKFYPQGLNIGIIISSVSLILIIIYIKKNK